MGQVLKLTLQEGCFSLGQNISSQGHAEIQLSRVVVVVLRRFCHVQLFVTLCSPPGSSVHGVLQARTLERSDALLQGIIPTQGSNPRFLYLLWQVGSLPQAPPGKPSDPG